MHAVLASKIDDVQKVMGEALEAYKTMGQVAPQAFRDLYIASVQVPPVMFGIAAGVDEIGAKIDIAIPKLVDASKLLKYIAGIPTENIGKQLAMPSIPAAHLQLKDIFGSADQLGGDVGAALLR